MREWEWGDIRTGEIYREGAADLRALFVDRADGAGIVLAHALNAVLDSAHGIEPEPDPQESDGVADPGEIKPSLPRAIASGPPPPLTEPADDYRGPEELRDVFEHLRAVGKALRNADITHDPTTDD